MNSTALERLRSWPRTPLAALPTRMVQASHLAATLGAAPDQIQVKMDAETGFALGGNKVRKLEFELAPERLSRATHLITTGGPQSNHCRVTAAAAAHLGLRCILVVNGEAPGDPRGNALLHRLFGAEIRTVASREERAPAMEAAAAEISRSGGRPLIVPLGASTPDGTLGYALAAAESMEQLETLRSVGRTWMFVSASSCGTLAGLLLGISLLGRRDVALVGVSADISADDMRAETLRLARGGAALLDWDGRLTDFTLECDDTQIGGGYGVVTPAAREAIDLFGRTHGIVLDPVYTGKAAAGLVAWVRRGEIPPGDRVVFVHTGGHPALLV
ncbi:MAG TPA: pyridoxal-phosphate dependent enzyme [Longimicrobiales bacterium]|nr:pyridoxal-phosphate dependent enzyme [Longimicrobiales bacterium]